MALFGQCELDKSVIFVRPILLFFPVQRLFLASIVARSELRFYLSSNAYQVSALFIKVSQKQLLGYHFINACLNFVCGQTTAIPYSVMYIRVGYEIQYLYKINM